MGLLSRLVALERRTPPAPTPAPLTDEQQDRLARRLVVVYADEGREGLIARLTRALGEGHAERVADRVAGALTTL